MPTVAPQWGWDWEDFCGTNSTSMHVLIGDDFGHCFEQVAFMCPTHMLFTIISAYYAARLHNISHIASEHIPKPGVIIVRLVISLLLLILPILSIVLKYTLYFDTGAKVVDLVTDGVLILTWFMHSMMVWKLRLAYVAHVSLRGPLSVIFMYFLAMASVIIRVHTTARTQISNHSLDVEGWLCYTSMVLYVLYLLTLIHSKKPISQPYLNLQSPTETSRILSYGHAHYGTDETMVQTDLSTTYSDVNILGKLFYTWVPPLLKRGSRECIKRPEDLFTVPESLNVGEIRHLAAQKLHLTALPPRKDNLYIDSETLNTSIQSVNSFENSTTSDRLQSSREIKPNLLKALNKAFGWHYYPLGVLKVIADIGAFASPVMLNYLVNYMENPKEPVKNGYIYAAGLLCATLVQAFTNNQFGYHYQCVALKVRASLVTLVYQKALSVSNSVILSVSQGEILNHMSTDNDRVVNFCATFHQLWSLPLQVGLSLYLLYNQVGLACLAGLAFTILVIPINRAIAVKIGTLSEKMMGEKDNRVKVTQEALAGIRVVKYYTLEEYFSRRISGLRSLELKSLSGRKYLDALCVYFWASTPVLISILTFGTYALLGNTVTAAKVFTSLAVFNILTMPLNAFPWVINGFMEARVSLRRLQKFIDLEEVDEKQYYTQFLFDPSQRNLDHETVVTLDGAAFTWTNHKATDDTKQNGGENNAKNGIERNLHGCLSDLTVDLRQGEFVGVVGKVGSGKSSFLNAIMAEMTRTSGQIHITCSLTGFGYCSQEAWIQQGTVRDNILCGSIYNAERYNDVLHACALVPDMKLLAFGDKTEVGESGVTLSGGQKARISLARAVYQDKDIYLLDDPFSAVDAHVAQHILTHCILGLLKHKTRIVCTHHVSRLRNADWILVFDDGRISQSGPPEDVLSHLKDFEPKRKKNDENKEDEINDLKNTERARLIEDEEQETGSVKLSVYKAYWKAVGSFLSGFILFSVFLMQASKNINDWWLAYWVTHSHNASDTESPIFADLDTMENPTYDFSYGNSTPIPWSNVTASSDNLGFYLTVYASLAVGNSFFTFIRAFSYAYGGICAAKSLHSQLLAKILKAPTFFFDSTPLGRIINRFSSDVYAIDDSLPFILNIFLAQAFSLIGVLVITCYGLPWVLVLLVPLGFLYYFIQKYYRMTSRAVKRIVSVSQSPVYAHFSETLSGLSTIRAFRIVEQFCEQNISKYTDYQRASYSMIAAGCWFDIWLQMIGVALVTGVAFIAVLEHHFRYVSSGLVGLAISYALSVTGLLNGVVQAWTETEKQMVSVERAQQYIDNIPSERKYSVIRVPSTWPFRGCIIFDNVVMKYKHANTNALDVVSFDVRSGEKIGIVGRTGSGKSSLLQALYRMVEIHSGRIMIDDVNIAYISLEDLRSGLAIIPQDPVLFSGTVRENLDPHEKYTDRSMYSVLDKCHMTIPVRRIGGLDAEIAEGGKSFSVGQKQLLCLARALLTGAKIICLDEATANIDNDTDALIQQTLRTELDDVTVLCVAHRLSTVLDSDRVLVMDGGRAVEFAPPRILMKRPDSLFARMANETG